MLKRLTFGVSPGPLDLGQPSSAWIKDGPGCCPLARLGVVPGAETQTTPFFPPSTQAHSHPCLEAVDPISTSC